MSLVYPDRSFAYNTLRFALTDQNIGDVRSHLSRQIPTIKIVIIVARRRRKQRTEMEKRNSRISRSANTRVITKRHRGYAPRAAGISKQRVKISSMIEATHRIVEIELSSEHQSFSTIVLPCFLERRR